MKTRPVVLVEWIDHASSDTAGWKLLDDFELGLSICQTAGFLYEEDDERITIVSSFNDAGEYDGDVTVARICIKSMVTLSED
jgi:hypothetical protein